MKRILWTIAAAGAAAVALFLLIFALIPRDTLKTRIGEQIAAWTGRAVSLSGEPDVDFFPRLSVTLRDVRVGGPEGMEDAEIISIERLEGTIRLLPLIIGRVEVGSFTIVRPLVRLVRDDGGARNWAFDSGAAALQLAFAGDVPLGEFVVEDGALVYENRQRDVTERLDALNLTVGWPSVRQPLAISGSGIWRGEQVTFTAGAAAPFDFLNGEATPVEAQVDSARLAMAFGGSAIDDGAPQVSGALSMTTPSLRRFLSWLGNPIGPGSTLGAASLSGDAMLRENTLSVDAAELALDGNEATGALALTIGPHPAVTGTLAFTALDLTPYFAGFSADLRARDDWRAADFDTSWFGDLDADIRFSADSANAGDLQLGETAGAVSLRDARLELGVARADLLGGGIAGNLTVADLPDTRDAVFEAQLRATDFDLAAAAAALALAHPMSGTASANVDVTSRGSDLGALLRGLSGIAKLDVSGGSFPLFGIAEIAVGGAGANPQLVGVAAATPVKALSAGFSFSNGVAILEMASVAALSFSASAKGWIGLEDGSIGLNGTVQPGTSDAAPALPFTIGGTLAEPLARPLAALAN
jgi:uncharacterized protein involved in outer membrane biogenesis